MPIPIYQVDAFTSSLFRGNPAAVCPLRTWLPTELMQQIAAENNLAETAFFVSSGERHSLRWFTPVQEVELCGHATLATAFVLCEVLGHASEQLAFDTLSGELRVERNDKRYTLDFPSRPATTCTTSPQLIQALGQEPQTVLAAARDYLAVFATEEELRALQPNMELLAGMDKFVIASAPGRESDFVSRFFAPSAGIPEDPVTGSAHCTLIPYWAERLGKPQLYARQISVRGGELYCALRGDRVGISGEAVLYLRGEIAI